MSAGEFGWGMFVVVLSVGLGSWGPAAEGAVVYVSPASSGNGSGSSWANSSTLGDAVNNGHDGDELWVRSGVYGQGLMGEEKRISFYGGFAGNETAREQRNWQTQLTDILCPGGTSIVSGARAIVDGFHLIGRNGYLDIGVLADTQFSSLTLVNCTITNTAPAVCVRYPAQVSLVNCTFSSNLRSSPQGNMPDCSGLYCDGRASLNSCTFTDNQARCIFVNGPTGSVAMESCSILGSASASLYLTSGDPYHGAVFSATNCVFARNGGGFSCRFGAAVRLTNCTVVDNSWGIATGVDYGQRIIGGQSDCRVTNCILWNGGQEMYGQGIDFTVSHCAVQGGCSGPGSFPADPLFVNRDGGDYHLQDGSPCVDRGLLSGAPSLDRDGQPRPGGDGLVDIGAYESAAPYLPGATTYTPKRLYVRAEAASGGTGLSWAQAFNSITAALRITSTSDEIWVKQGEYAGPLYMEPTVGIYGGFAGNETARAGRNWRTAPTTIHGTYPNQGDSAVCGADQAILEAFTITDGYSRFGGGLSCEHESPTVRNCIITGNRAWGTGPYSAAGVQAASSTLRLLNCEIVHNVMVFSTNGAGISSNGGDLELSNCVIADNYTGSCGLAAVYSMITITNSIMRNNVGDIADYNKSNTFFISYSATGQDYGGTGNVHTAPHFVDEANGDYHLQSDSPCIDAGNPEAQYNDGCLPPGQGTARNDMGYYGGPDNCDVAWSIPTETPTDTPTALPTDTPTGTPTITPTYTLTDTPTITPTYTLTDTPTDTPTATETPLLTATDTPTIAPSETPSFTPSVTETVAPAASPTATVYESGVRNNVWERLP